MPTYYSIENKQCNYFWNFNSLQFEDPKLEENHAEELQKWITVCYITDNVNDIYNVIKSHMRYKAENFIIHINKYDNNFKKFEEQRLNVCKFILYQKLKQL